MHTAQHLTPVNHMHDAADMDGLPFVDLLALLDKLHAEDVLRYLTDTETEAQATANLLISATQEAYTWTRMCLTKLISAEPTEMAMPKAAFSSTTTLSTVAID
ncbi:hypothetical protein ACFX2J_033367 [Malus domestica]|uniref:Uncharacterized protein n=1 Tax=Malus domestica TaxID=3750 RepID=A0A498K1F6_MALDO|nr:hypothetical protein DVH24_015348 [Malus domestica]